MAFRAIFPEVSNQADWNGNAQLTDRASGQPIDMSNIVTATLALQLLGQCNSPILSGSLATGEITFPTPGIMLWRFPAARMQGLTPGAYDVGIILADAVPNTWQFIIGRLPVAAGLPGFSPGPQSWDYS